MRAVSVAVGAILPKKREEPFLVAVVGDSG
jgi:hypothetical protein